ncbi:sigma 54-interacting transcriptional regulator [Thermoactinomyces sp. CICC 10522]|nr:sigma 54-interacting transcriptional regulator [Thermoactinomyces sp. CICC 10522]
MGFDIYSRLSRTDESNLVLNEIKQVLKQGKTLIAHPLTIDGKVYVVTASPIYHNNVATAIFATFEEVSIYRSLFDVEFESFQTTIDDLQTIFDNSYDVLYVTDRNGRTLRVSSACEILWGKKPEELIGRTVYELEEEGVYRPSATRLALERGKKVQIVQQTRTGRRLMVVSTPIRDKYGNIVRVVNASRDITEIQELEQEINQLKSLTEGYRKQLTEVQRNRAREENLLIYSSKAMSNIVYTIEKVASVDSTVLITGESGVGKEVVANCIHQLSPRSNGPIIKLNCAAIPESLLESELFGYEEGAFTGASRHGKAGLFELASGGTLFLDEIGDMPLGLQAKLLRVLQDGELMRIGGRKPIKVNVRIIAATNQMMGNLIQNGLFRKDLYYRLNVIPITIPPLRKRKEDIIPLVRHFLELFNKRYGKQISLSTGALRILMDYSWPGNVRELQNVIERVVVTADTNQVDEQDLSMYIGERHTEVQLYYDDSFTNAGLFVNEIMPLKDVVRKAEMYMIGMAAQRCRTLAEMAALLQVDQSTISRKMKKYKLSILQNGRVSPTRS